ncbi:MAG: tetratricopeptide repeat protein [Gemmataceae bacterium]|nr:tetratricopeptide repeat protein [Gemmataceae bacterium]
MRRRLNLRLAVYLVVLVPLVAVGVHLLHGYQVQRNASAFLAQADRFEQDGNLAGAITYLERYVNLTPDDSDALARMGLLLERTAKTPREHLRAFFVLESALRQAPQQHDVRRQLVRLTIAQGRPTDAQDHLNVLMQDFPNDAELEGLQAQCALATAQFARAAEWLAKATQHEPQRVEYYAQLASVLRRRLNRPQEADRVMDQMVAANPRSAPAYLSRGTYAAEFLSMEKASADVAQARALAPDDAEVLLASAEFAMASNRLDDARGYLERGMQLHAKDARLCQSLARVELRAGRRDQAVEHLRRSVEVLNDQPRALWTTLELLIDAGETSEARTVLARLERTPLLSALLDHSRGRLQMQERNWSEARRLLDRARAKLGGQPELHRDTHMLLAICHQNLGNVDLLLAAYRAALDIDATWLPARLGLAAATASAGRTDEAAALYDKLLPQAPGARLTVARLQMQRTMRLPRDQRRWPDVQRLLDDAPETMRQLPEWTILRAELLLAQDRIDAARELLEAARREQPKRVEFPLALAALAAKQKQADQVSTLLDEVAKDFGDSVDLRLARATLRSDRTGKDMHALLGALASNSDKFTRDEQQRLLRGLIVAGLRSEDVPLLRQLTNRLLALQPSDCETRLLQFRLALQDRDADACRRLVKELREQEGEDGSAWRYADAAQRVRFAAAGDRAALAEARTRLVEAAKARPNWSLLVLLDAEVCEREGNVEGALEKYRQAIAMGDRQPQVVRRAVQLLHERRRYAEAQDVLRKLEEQTPLTGDLGRLAAEVSFFNHAAPEQTLELARRAVSADAKDYRNLLWLGQILGSLKQTEEAEKTLRRAVDLAGDMPETWTSLILFLARNQQKEAAEKALTEARKRLPATQAMLPLAVCHEALGQGDKARECYRWALASQPDDPLVLRAVAGFHMRMGQPVEAQAHLRKLLASSGDGAAVWARRNLALALVMGGGYAPSVEALALVEQNLKQPNPAVEDQRARALVLAAQPNRRRDSIRALEDSFARVPPTPDEQFLLARLHEADRDWSKARRQLLPLVSGGDSVNPLYLAYYIDALLRHQDTREAELWLGRFEKLEPESWRTLQFKARLLTQRKQGDEAIRLLRAYKGEAAGLPVALLLEELGHTAAAEPVMRQFAADAKGPEGSLALAAFLGRRGKTEEALDLCERAAVKCPPESIAATCIGILRAAPAPQAQLTRVDQWLTASLRKKPTAPVLLIALADLRDLQGRYADALAMYRLVLQNDPKNALAINNLAVLLALHEKSAESVELTKRGMELAGPAPFLLDTRAMCHLALGKGELAVGDLEEAVAIQPTAVRYFHLAQAHRAVRNRTASVAAYQKAKNLGLTAQLLHPLERNEFEKLKAEHEGR